MRTKFALVPSTEQSLSAPSNLSGLQQDLGLIKSFQATRAIRKEQARVSTSLNVSKLQAEERIGKTELAIAEVQIKGALVAGGIANLGALEEDINQKVGVVQDRLTASTAAELGLHIETRFHSHRSIDGYLAQGLLTPDEAAALKDRATANFVNNVDRSQERLENSKVATETIRSLAQSGLRRAAESIK